MRKSKLDGEILISVIIPIYNATSFIERCLWSIFKQSIQNFEIILIDDCSNDDTVSVVLDLIKRAPAHLHNRITFLQNCQNLGQSFSRNRGIKFSKGRYLFFVDSDDEISYNCLEVLSKKLDCDTEMVIGNYKMVGYQNISSFTLKEGIYCSKEIIPLQLKWEIYTMPWNKLISKSFIVQHELYFQEGLIHEDNLWSFCCAFCFKKIAVVQEYTYTYYIREGSTERSNTREFHEENLFRVQLYTLQYLFKNQTVNRKLRYRKDIYKFIEREIKNFIIVPYINGDIEKATYRYSRLREVSGYSLWHFIFMRLGIKSFKRTLHYFMPLQKGFRYYIKKYK